MSRNMRWASIAAVISLIVAPIITMSLGFEWAVTIMVEIAVIAFFTVLFVMIVGSVEDHYPSDAEDSSAVNAWNDRLSAREQEAANE